MQGAEVTVSKYCHCLLQMSPAHCEGWLILGLWWVKKMQGHCRRLLGHPDALELGGLVGPGCCPPTVVSLTTIPGWSASEVQRWCHNGMCVWRGQTMTEGGAKLLWWNMVKNLKARQPTWLDPEAPCWWRVSTTVVASLAEWVSAWVVVTALWYLPPWEVRCQGRSPVPPRPVPAACGGTWPRRCSYRYSLMTWIGR